MSQLNPEEAPADAEIQGEGQQKERSGSLRFLLDVVETIVLSLVLFLGINLVSARIRVDGESMVPSLNSGEFIIVNRLAYKLGNPSHGDVIVFRFPRDPNQEFIKRVIGLPGDEIRILGGTVSVNGQRMEEDYIAAPPGYQGEWRVPEGTVFVLGDNRNNSSDSHDWGPVPLGDIIGKAVFVYWPPNQWGLIDHPAVASAGN